MSGSFTDSDKNRIHGKADGVRSDSEDNRESWRIIGERSMDLHLSVDSDGRFIEINPATSRLLGLSETEISKHSWLEYVAPQDVDHARSMFEHWLTSGCESAAIEFSIIGATGQQHRVLWTTQFHRDTDGILVRLDAVGRNITEFELTREAGRAFIDHSLQGLVIVQDGVVVFANTAFEQLTGFTLSEMIKWEPNTFLDFVSPKDRQEVADQVQRQIEGDPLTDICEFEARRKDGSAFFARMLHGLTMFRGRPALQVAFMDVTEQREAARELEASRHRYDQLFQASQLGIFVAQDGRIKTANPRVLDFVGLTAEQAADMPLMNLVHPDDREAVAQRHTARMQGNDVETQYTFRVIDAEGHTRWIEVSVTMIEWEGRPATLNITDDVTDRKLADDALRASEERYRMIFHNSPLGIMHYDKHGVITDCNSELVRILGSSREALVGFDMLARIKDPGLLKAVRDVLTKGAGYYEGYYTSVTGNKTTPVKAEFNAIFGKDVGFVGAVAVFQDITDQLKYEAELQNSRIKYSTLADHSADVIMRFDRQHRHLYVNQTVEDITGIPPAEFLGKTHRDMKFEDSLANLWESALDQVFRTGEPMNIEFQHRSPSGLIFIDTRMVPEMSAGDRVETVLATSRDVTETRRLQEFAARAQRLETAGRIAGQVAHDFNNLLGPLMAYPELIRSELPEDHPVLGYIEDMELAAEQISDINQQLLTLGRRGHYNLEPLNINDVIELAVRQLPDRPDNINVRLELAEDIMNIRGGNAQIHRIVSNLLTNACDAIGEAGMVTVRTQNYYVDTPDEKHGRVPVGEYVKMTISDTGPGIPEDIQPKIFDPFFTTKTSDRKRGSGLGLSVVHAVVEDHQGYMDFRSQPGQGTSMYVYFPITRDRIDITVPSQAVGGDESILVVDDDHVQRDVSSKLLEKLGYRVHAATSAKESLQAVEQERFDLILMDMILPGDIDGADALSRIREVIPDQKAIIVSGYAESDRVEIALKKGAVEFLRKPFTLRSIALAVRRALDKS